MTDKKVVQLLEHMGRCYRRSYVPMEQSRVESIRALLVQELHAGEAPATIPAEPRFVFSLPSFAELFHVRALRPVIAVLVLGVFGAGSLLKVASASLPGDTLYTVKLVKEAAQVRLAVDEQSRAKLSVQFAVTRADEMKRVVESGETRERKAEQLSIAMAGLQDHVSRATDALAASQNKKEFVAVVEEGTEQIASILHDAKEAAAKGNGVVSQEVAKALTSINETKALVQLAANPPAALVSSVPMPKVTAEEPAVPHTSQEVEKKVVRQPAVFTNIAQSVFSLPFAQSVSSEGNLPFATSVGSAP